MPYRRTPLVTDSYYHIFNRGIDRQPTFLTKRDYERAIQTLSYYRPATNSVKYSQFLKKPQDEREEILTSINRTGHQITIIAFCLMPNHFHLLLKQNEEIGISKFMANFQNSYVKYFNVKHKRTGSLFDRQFKVVLVESENQLLHLTRYIHLNPFSSHLINRDGITTYPYTSLPEYLSGSYTLSDPNKVLDIYPKRYEKFILDHADYQQRLESLKHLTLESPENI
jgi:putative transposase